LDTPSYGCNWKYAH